jgi:hypothetical protein
MLLKIFTAIYVKETNKAYSCSTVFQNETHPEVFGVRFILDLDSYLG